MRAFARTDSSVFGRWWWTVDHWTLWAVAALIGFGAVMTLAASPAVADHLGLNPFYFAHRQFIILPAAAAVIVAISLMPPEWVRRLAVVLLAVALIGVVATLFGGTQIKGARRWIGAGGFSVQPSEFVKPCFIVVSAWLLSRRKMAGQSQLSVTSLGLFAVVILLLVMQPDMGMVAVISTVWLGQMFMAGLPLRFMAILAALAAAGMVAAYLLFPHVASRVDRFLDPDVGDHYQVTTSLEAFENGGLFGRGPGEGTVKQVLPDAHADFVLAVAGEEMGLLACLAIVALYGFIVLRGFVRMLQENDFFILLAASGLLAQFGLQALINMGSTLDLLPTKGMTLPFISYGGSSVIALAIGMGMLLSLSRRRTAVGGLR